jgi:hypothetical protein
MLRVGLQRRDQFYKYAVANVLRSGYLEMQALHTYEMKEFDLSVNLGRISDFGLCVPILLFLAN